MLVAIFKPLAILVAAVCGLFAAWLFYRQRISKSPKTVRLLEPHFSVPQPPARPKTPKVEADDSTSGDLAVESAPSLPAAKSSPWSLELLRQVKCPQFEELIAAYFRELSFRTETVQVGTDEGKDIKLFEKGKAGVFAIVQCKACDTQTTGVRSVRELLGVMTHDKVSRGVFVATGDYTDAATEFAKQHPIILITGEMLVNDILTFSEDANTRLMKVAAEGGLEVKQAAAEAESIEMDAAKEGGSDEPDPHVIEFPSSDGNSELWPKS
ncbi:MAG: restriction endonuclease [Betaproteobacteria bacterium]|nr:restriction endonuclease [Betaproteobacteria bacterium]